jgi:hypothetical protein
MPPVSTRAPDAAAIPVGRRTSATRRRASFPDVERRDHQEARLGRRGPSPATACSAHDQSRAQEDLMANERGLLPKARREELSESLQEMLGRWYRNAYEDDNLFLTMARRPGLLEATWGFIRYIYGGGSSVEPELFELVRVKLAWNNQCVH